MRTMRSLNSNNEKVYNKVMKIVGIDITQSDKPCSLVILDDQPEIKNVYDQKDEEEIIFLCSEANLIAIDCPHFSLPSYAA
jgi:predicted nuclease with RNAse H fold